MITVDQSRLLHFTMGGGPQTEFQKKAGYFLLQRFSTNHILRAGPCPIFLFRISLTKRRTCTAADQVLT